MNPSSKGNKWTVVSFEDGSQQEPSAPTSSVGMVARGSSYDTPPVTQERFEGVISDSVVVNEMGSNGFMTTWKVTKRPRGGRKDNIRLPNNNMQQQKSQQNNLKTKISSSTSETSFIGEEHMSDLRREAMQQFELALELSKNPPTRAIAHARTKITIGELLT
jgi:hypothetical protein